MAPRKAFEWDVFISHNSKQKPWARLAVGQWRQLGLLVFFDEDSIDPGEGIIDGIERGLKGSRRVVLVLTQAAVASSWVALETALALQDDPAGNQQRLIPVLLEPMPTEGLRPALARLRWVDLTNPELRRDDYHRLLKCLKGGLRPPLPEPPPWLEGGTPDPATPAVPPRTAPKRQSRTGPHRIDLFLDRDFDSYTDDEQEHLLGAVRSLLQIGAVVQVGPRRRGSVVLTLELPWEHAERICWAVEAGELAAFGVVRASLTEVPAEPSTTGSGRLPATSGGSVSIWLSGLRLGEGEALEKLHSRYWPFLIGLARKRLLSPDGRKVDEEQVALDAFASMCRRLKGGELPRPANRGELVSLLTRTVAHKVISELRSHNAAKRASSAEGSDIGARVARLTDAEPTPLEQAILHDNYRHYLSALDDNLRPFAEYHLAGYSVLEISEFMNCSTPTVKRKLHMIRLVWQGMMDDSLNRQPEAVR
jgi:DNA-directed RNA polymerase specialized sigma24 family protein